MLRWVDSFSPEKLRGIRFLAANPLAATLAEGEGGAIGSNLEELADELADHLPVASARNRLLLRMAMLSINAAVHAASRAEIPDEDIILAAHDAARLLIAEAVAG